MWTERLAGWAADVSRREWLKRVGCGAALGLTAGGGRPRTAHAAVTYQGLRSADYLGDVQVECRVEDDKIFTEGPAVDHRGRVLFTNVPVSKILQWDPQRRQLRTYRSHSNESNGLLFAPNGDLLACEGGAQRVTRTDRRTGAITVLASEFRGFPLAKPNDLELDQQGRLYFTSRPGVDDPTKGNVNAVYRVDPDGRLHQLLAWPDIHMPNGIVISPDQRTLYLIEAHPDADRNRSILAFDLGRDGSLSRRRTLIDLYPGRSGDGMAIDAEGNLYVAAGLHKTRDTSETLDTRPGIHTISPEGRLLAFVETPEDTITNCTFGGPDLKTLYVTCGTLLLSVRTRIPGKPSYRIQA